MIGKVPNEVTYTEIDGLLGAIPLPQKSALPEQNCVTWTGAAICKLQENGLVEQFDLDRFMDESLAFVDQRLQSSESTPARSITLVGVCDLRNASDLNVSILSRKADVRNQMLSPSSEKIWLVQSPPESLLRFELVVIFLHSISESIIPLWPIYLTIVCLSILPIFRVPAAKLSINDRRDLPTVHYDIPRGDICVGEAASITTGVAFGDLWADYFVAFLDRHIRSKV